MAKCAYNYAKNASIAYTSLKLNCNYHPYIFFNKDTDLYSKSKIANKLLA